MSRLMWRSRETRLSVGHNTVTQTLYCLKFATATFIGIKYLLFKLLIAEQCWCPVSRMRKWLQRDKWATATHNKELGLSRHTVWVYSHAFSVSQNYVVWQSEIKFKSVKYQMVICHQSHCGNKEESRSAEQNSSGVIDKLVKGWSRSCATIFKGDEQKVHPL